MPEFYFDSTEIPLEQGYGSKQKDVIPNGEYVVMINQSKSLDHKNGDKSIILEVIISKGAHAGKMFEIWISLRSSTSPDKVRMSKVRLALICAAVGKEKIRATEELHDKPFLITLEAGKKPGYQNIGTIKPLEQVHANAAPAKAEVMDAVGDF